MRLRGGTVFEAMVNGARGSIHHPLTQSEVEDRFRLLAGPVLGRKVTASVIETVSRLGERKACRCLVTSLAAD